ncbi:ROK family protein [Geobacillus sp. MR]|uniref:ROK family protein n=1 Tax=Geobacillus sp. MR TaxID=2508875 RepID=UPI00148CBA74|nr:ROK family protein [Geobacillus sp. MR]NNU88076.1 ROK family protein [Geobacillus sp. MR]
MMEKDFAIGLDLGGTKILTALMDKSGDIICKFECETLADQGEKVVIERVLSSIQQVLDTSKINQSRVRGIGVATAGVIDSKKGEIVVANNLGWRNVPIGRLIYDRFGIPVNLSNDANAAVIAEWIWGAGSGKQNLIYITVSTGIGAGIISNGHLITGVDNSAGEFGHISIESNGHLCSCGNRGCLETLASGTAIARIARERLINGETSEYLSSRVNDVLDITAKEIGEAAKYGDPFSIKLLNEVGYYLGIGVTNLIHLFNTEVIIFGGGVMNADEILLPIIRKTVQERGIRAMVEKVKIEKSTVGEEVGVKGAAGLFFIEREKEYI